MMLFRFLSTTNIEAKRFVKDVKCGLHSGFKPCCIIWFTTIWRYNFLGPRRNSRLLIKYHEFSKPVFSGSEEDYRIKPGYVPCPRCALLEEYVKVKKCQCAKRTLDKYPNIKRFWKNVGWKFILFYL